MRAVYGKIRYISQEGGTLPRYLGESLNENIQILHLCFDYSEIVWLMAYLIKDGIIGTWIGIFAWALVEDQCTDETHLYAKDLIQSKKKVRFKLFLQGLGPTEQGELTFVKTKRKTDPESSESDLLLKQPLSLIMLETRALQFNLQIIVSPWLVVLATHFRSYLRRQACSC